MFYQPDGPKMKFEFEITPNAECADIYESAGVTIIDSHVCARTSDPSTADDMCRGNNEIASPMVTFVSRFHFSQSKALVEAR